MRLLVTRPEPAAAATAARLRAMGHDVVVAPLLATQAVAWDAPEPAAIAFTSVNGVRFAGGRWPHLPAFAVGATTAAAARDAGHTDVRDGGGTAAALLATVAAQGFARVLHLAGADVVDAAVPPGLTVDRVTVYAAVPVPLGDATMAALAAGTIDAALVYSPRSAALLADAVPARAALRLAAISPAAARAAGSGWRAVAVAAAPTEDALFAAALALCDRGGDDDGSDDGAL